MRQGRPACSALPSGGVLSHARGSNLANATLIAGWLGRRNALQDLYTRPMAPEILRGPVLADARYPDVLVARAVSEGTGLDLVLYGTPDNTAHDLGLARLQPGMDYCVTERPGLRFTADSTGHASITVNLSGRTVLTIRPAVLTQADRYQ
jgi:hypothetical protein